MNRGNLSDTRTTFSTTAMSNYISRLNIEIRYRVFFAFRITRDIKKLVYYYFKANEIPPSI